MEFIGIKDIDNIILKNLRDIRPINIGKINEEIKNIVIEDRNVFNFNQRTIYFDNRKNRHMMIVSCCKKCGKYQCSMKVWCGCTIVWENGKYITNYKYKL